MSRKSLKKLAVGAVAVLSLGAATMASTAASAHPWHEGWDHDGRGSGAAPAAALFAGILGLAVGASLAHQNYAPPPPAYAGPGYYGYGETCRSHWRWDPYWGRYVQVTRCY
ncbi:MAG: hypothetical protein ACREEW_03440 [Caulobacteraceae bacterium]